jgi:hypothetical protein
VLDRLADMKPFIFKEFPLSKKKNDHKKEKTKNQGNEKTTTTGKIR